MDQLITNYSASGFHLLFQLSVRQLSRHFNLHGIQIMIIIKDVQRNKGKKKEKTRHMVNNFGNRGLISFVLDLYRMLPLYTVSYLNVVPACDRNGITPLLSRAITGSLLLKIFPKLSSPCLRTSIHIRPPSRVTGRLAPCVVLTTCVTLVIIFSLEKMLL